MFDSGLEENLWNNPALPLLLDRIHHRLDDERLKRAEFRSWLTEDMKAEFINGSIVMHSPAADDHNEVVINLGGMANFYVALKKIGKVRVEKALVGMTRNDYEPDIAFWRKEVADRFEPGMNVYPIPDLIIEVLSPGKKNLERDTQIKFDDYAAHRVPEYWIVDPKKKTVEQYLLSDTLPDRYDLYKKAILTDNIESIVLAGFAIPVRAIFEPDANAEAMQRFLRESR
ncbi:MAG: Uma2 family endonuclease [Lewinellaceae bacterium]|nr:Uma2 family endonuclease [Saprospiraceae bacterium]MCB9339537.1 Uma2 family endonuclease [Lewinellaceae bacterium]